jgi:hypothetical protein
MIKEKSTCEKKKKAVITYPVQRDVRLQGCRERVETGCPCHRAGFDCRLDGGDDVYGADRGDQWQEYPSQDQLARCVRDDRRLGNTVSDEA